MTAEAPPRSAVCTKRARSDGAHVTVVLSRVNRHAEARRIHAYSRAGEPFAASEAM